MKTCCVWLQILLSLGQAFIWVLRVTTAPPHVLYRRKTILRKYRYSQSIWQDQARQVWMSGWERSVDETVPCVVGECTRCRTTGVVRTPFFHNFCSFSWFCQSIKWQIGKTFRDYKNGHVCVVRLHVPRIIGRRLFASLVCKCPSLFFISYVCVLHSV
jgi:hypothetical protein